MLVVHPTDYCYNRHSLSPSAHKCVSLYHHAATILLLLFPAVWYQSKNDVIDNGYGI